MYICIIPYIFFQELLLYFVFEMGFARIILESIPLPIADEKGVSNLTLRLTYGGGNLVP